jgi:hypothetical protein
MSDIEPAEAGLTIESEYTDRYGGPANWPDPDTVCKGQCEGMGVYPTKVRDTGSVDADYEFVTCEECDPHTTTVR